MLATVSRSKAIRKSGEIGANWRENWIPEGFYDGVFIC